MPCHSKSPFKLLGDRCLKERLSRGICSQSAAVSGMTVLIIVLSQSEKLGLKQGSPFACTGRRELIIVKGSLVSQVTRAGRGS